LSAAELVQALWSNRPSRSATCLSKVIAEARYCGDEGAQSSFKVVADARNVGNPFIE